jgi:[acyl-carrier-protein] S-malonyltransferase
MTRKIAALFPGQGSQTVGMTRAFYDESDAAHPVLERAFQVIPGLEALMFEGPEDELKLTQNAQPALVASGIACYRAWKVATNRRPHYSAGHSLGEFSAHVAAKTLEFDDALRLVRARGKYMQAAVPVGEGAMAAILKVDLGVIREVVEAIDGVQVANLNTPEQTVISGTTAAVSQASEQLKAKGARVIPLQVSAPFHSSLMQPARERLERDFAVTEWHSPEFPVIANVSAQPVTDVDEIKRLLSEQVTGSVRWVESIQALVGLGVTEFIEFGPGSVLTGMVKRIVPDARTFNISSPTDLDAYVRANA